MTEFILWIAILATSGASSQQAMVFKTEALCEAARVVLISKLSRDNVILGARGVEVRGACVAYYP